MIAPAPDWFALLDATWPAARIWPQGRWLLRDGQGGGQRVSAATALGAAPADIPEAEAAQRSLGQVPLFRLADAETALDAALAARGYGRRDETVLLAAPVRALTDTSLPPLSTFPVWPPLAVQAALWDAGGIGPARRAVMARAAAPRVAILGRQADRVAATAFVAIHDGAAMLHALQVDPSQRRSGMGARVMRAAAHWAADHGAGWLAVAVTRANGPACTLYASLGMAEVGGYHYRGATQEGA